MISPTVLKKESSNYVSNLSDEYFDMSPLQQAYWIGQNGIYEDSCIGFVSSDYLVEKVDVEKLKRSAVYVVEKYLSLKLGVSDDGMQSINYLSNLSFSVNSEIDDKDIYIESSNKDKVEDIFVSQKNVNLIVQLYQGKDKDIVSISSRLICVDGQSFNRVVDCIFSVYSDECDCLFNEESEYIEYVDYLAERKKSRSYKKSLRFWKNNLHNIHPSPKLPKVKNKDKLKSKFDRLSFNIDNKTWKKAKEIFENNGITSNAVLCYLYVYALRKWSENKEFSLNMMVSDYCLNTEKMKRMVGNCSTTMLVSFDNGKQDLLENIIDTERKIYASLQNSIVSGVDVLRLKSQETSDLSQFFIPYIYNSSLGIDNKLSGKDDKRWEWVNTYLQTPQILLDAQVYEHGGELFVHWDYIKNEFPPNLIEDMFLFYKSLVNEISNVGFDYKTGLKSTYISQCQSDKLYKYNDVSVNYENGLLHQGFINSALLYPDNVAIKTRSNQVTYGEVFNNSTMLSNKISSSLQKTNQIVAIYTDRGINQIISVLAVLISGNTYIIVDSKLPEKRALNIIKHSGATLVISHKSIIETVKENITCAMLDIECSDNNLINNNVAVNNIVPDDLAYVIYTSGSTGEPKGVMISHEAALNTINDTSNKFSVTSDDSVFCVSSLNFDLSVFDMFAFLSAGASIVLTDDQEIPEPKHWLDLIEQYKPTIWNSVPALMEVLIDYLSEEKLFKLQCIRLAMFSGDWVSPNMVSTLLHNLPNTKLISLGGATEVSIWSCYYEIKELLDGWVSIPYGIPLANQHLYVLDEELSLCPEWVEGELYIGGHGVACGYLNDETKTYSSFIHHEVLGRLYKTGDKVRFREGMIEFLGRIDSQVKIRGFRIELGEIESVALKYSGVDSVVVLVVGNDISQKSISLVYVPVKNREIDTDDFLRYMSELLPSYMVPKRILKLDKLMLTANGKIDRKALTEYADDLRENSNSIELPTSDTEIIIHEIWSDVLGNKEFGVHDSFFSVGGSSMQAIILSTKIHDKITYQISPSQILQFNTIYKMSQLINNNKNLKNENIVNLFENDKSESIVIFFHPVGGEIHCYNTFVNYFNDCSVYAIQLNLTNTNDCVDGSSFTQLSNIYVKQILNKFKNFKIALCGWSFGAVMALEVEHLLRNMNYQLQPTLLIDPWVSDGNNCEQFTLSDSIKSFVYDLFSVDIEIDDRHINYDEVMFWDKVLNDVNQKSVDTVITSDGLRESFVKFLYNSKLIRYHEFKHNSRNAIYVKATKERSGLRKGLMPLDELSGVYSNKIMTLFEMDHWEIMSDEAIPKIIKIWKSYLN